jgi:hypothetical protein
VTMKPPRGGASHAARFRKRADAGGFKRAVEELAGGTDEGPSRQILAITGLFTDEHQACLSWTFAGDNLGCVFVERAAHATGLGCVQGLQRRDGGFRLFHATVTSGSTLRFVAARVGSQRNEVAHDPQA